MIARPLGAIIFGHFGDRFGRKATLVAAADVDPRWEQVLADARTLYAA